MTVAVDARRFADSPATYFGHSWHAMHRLPAQELEALQLAALQLRFGELRDQIPTLTAMADEQGVEAIEELDDVVPLLFQHSVYKSYPVSLLLNSRFAELTRWLSRLTTHDLSALDVSACRSVDEWLDVLDVETELRVAHSSGTTGTMSFLPRSAHEWDRMFEGARCGMFQFSDPSGAGGSHEGEYFDLIWPLYRHGRSAIMRMPEMGMKHLLGSEERLHVLRPGRMSSDTMLVAARLRAAAARGESDQLDVSPALRERRAEFEREQHEMATSMPRFINEVAHELAGQRIWLLGTWNVLYELARAALDNGLERVFAADSLVTTGGGAKGQAVPDDWEDAIRRFTGVAEVQHTYVMSEITALNKLCEQGRYHFEPWIVPFVLDPHDGSPLPREGQHTGRGAVFDLVAATYWGGFISGDELALSFNECACGRTTPHAARRIERYSDKQGGNDKITCVAAEDAHRAALQFLTRELG
jgi:hypothetical protein